MNRKIGYNLIQPINWYKKLSLIRFHAAATKELTVRQKKHTNKTPDRRRVTQSTTTKVAKGHHLSRRDRHNRSAIRKDKRPRRWGLTENHFIQDWVEHLFRLMWTSPTALSSRTVTHGPWVAPGCLAPVGTPTFFRVCVCQWLKIFVFRGCINNNNNESN